MDEAQALTRDELIKRLAGIAYDNFESVSILHGLKQDGWPLIVEFVAAWFGQPKYDRVLITPELIEHWRAEMRLRDTPEAQ